MNNYEITYIASGSLAEDARGQLDGTIDNKITELGGISDYASPALRRRLAYMVEDQSNGFLRALQIQLDPAAITTIHEYLQKEPSILRFAILKTTRRTEVPAEIVEKYAKKNTKKDGKPGRGTSTSTRTASPKAKTDDKEVSMADVEKGIEDALTEEVK
jgi:ribosomal protein S6